MGSVALSSTFAKVPAGVGMALVAGFRLAMKH